METNVYRPAKLPTVPVYKGLPILGNALQFGRDTIGTLERAWRTHGDLVEIRLGGRAIWIASSPELAQEVLVRGMHRFQRPNEIKGGTLLSLALGDSVLTTDGESWLARRRLMQPVFHRQRIAGMGTAMTGAGTRMLARWDALPAGQPVDLALEMKSVTLDIINRTMFSNDVTAGAGTIAEIGGLVDEMLGFMARFVRTPLRIPLSWRTPGNTRFLNARGHLERYLESVIAARRNSGETRDDLLQMLLDARDEDTGAAMNDTQIRNEVATIYAAGHETTALALTWTWHALNQNPEVLARLQREVDSVLAGRAPTMADLPALSYTLAVFEESMRLYPPVPFTVRKAVEPTTLGDVTVPAGRFIGIALGNIQRHPDYWPEPGRFNPERFLPENKTQLKREAYLPFLTGPHLCIGVNFALMEGQLLLAMMAQRYNVREVPGQRIEKEVTITMRPKHGLRATLARR